jgi:hypothetical protein
MGLIFIIVSQIIVRQLGSGATVDCQIEFTRFMITIKMFKMTRTKFIRLGIRKADPNCY